MNATDEPRRAGPKRLLIAAVLVLVTITQYGGLKDAVRDFGHGFRDGIGGR